MAGLVNRRDFFIYIYIYIYKQYLQFSSVIGKQMKSVLENNTYNCQNTSGNKPRPTETRAGTENRPGIFLCVWWCGPPGPKKCQGRFSVFFGRNGRRVLRTKEEKDHPDCYQQQVQKPGLSWYGVVSVPWQR